MFADCPQHRSRLGLITSVVLHEPIVVLLGEEVIDRLFGQTVRPHRIEELNDRRTLRADRPITRPRRKNAVFSKEQQLEMQESGADEFIDLFLGYTHRGRTIELSFPEVAGLRVPFRKVLARDLLRPL